MSFWTYVTGTIKVSPCGRTQAEKEYILKTVLSHLPKVTGSERDMEIYINQEKGFNSSSNHDEFFEESNLGNGRYGIFELQDTYLITVSGYLRDRFFEQTHKDFVRWLSRLAKRVYVEYCLVEIKGWEEKAIITNDNRVFTNMFESENMWCDYLMWNYNRTPEGGLLSGKPNNHKDNICIE